ncbi:MAG: lysophospholipid acyltransferase family protein [Pseudomonadales bacterium]
MSDIVDKIATRSMAATLRLMSWLPLRVSQAVGRLIGLVGFWLNSRSAKVARVNIETCFPELDAEARQHLVKDALIHTGMTLMETPATWLGRYDRINAWINKVDGEEILDQAKARQCGVVVLLPHIGNWELFNVYFSTRGNMTALYSPPRQKYLVSIMENIRSSFGNELVPANVKGVATLYRRLSEGKTVVVLPDQVPRNGVYAPFFGVEALTDTLVSRLLRKTNASVVCVYVRRNDYPNGFDVVYKKPDDDIYSNDLVTSAAAINRVVEACVREAPEQYQWAYKRYKERPAGERKLYRFNRPEGFH